MNTSSQTVERERLERLQGDQHPSGSGGGRLSGCSRSVRPLTVKGARGPVSASGPPSCWTEEPTTTPGWSPWTTCRRPSSWPSTRAASFAPVTVAASRSLGTFSANSFLYGQSTALRRQEMLDRFQAWEANPKGPPSWRRQGVLFELATKFENASGEWTPTRPDEG
jgi:hypothetical protein